MQASGGKSDLCRIPETQVLKGPWVLNSDPWRSHHEMKARRALDLSSQGWAQGLRWYSGARFEFLWSRQNLFHKITKRIYWLIIFSARTNFRRGWRRENERTKGVCFAKAICFTRCTARMVCQLKILRGSTQNVRLLSNNKVVESRCLEGLFFKLTHDSNFHDNFWESDSSPTLAFLTLSQTAVIKRATCRNWLTKRIFQTFHYPVIAAAWYLADVFGSSVHIVASCWEVITSGVWFGSSL